MDSLSQAPVARSSIAPAAPVAVVGGWEISTRRASGVLTLTDCSLLAKVQVRARVDGAVRASLGVPSGRAVRDGSGVLVVGSGPGEWLLIGSPGEAGALLSRAETLAAAAPDELVTAVDLTHGRTLVRLTGARAAALLGRLCGINLADGTMPSGTALRTAVAAVATDLIRDDVPVSGVPSYLLHVERSSGQYMADTLLDAGADLGVEVDGFPGGNYESF